jgi:hypothetical protein
VTKIDPHMLIKLDRIGAAHRKERRERIATAMQPLPAETDPRIVADLTGEPRPKDYFEVLRWWIKAEAAYRVMQADALIAELDRKPEETP